MTCRRYLLGCLLYFCCSCLVFVHLNRLQPFVDAAEQPSAGAGERRPADARKSGGGSSSAGGQETHEDGSQRETATTETDGSAAAPPTSEAPPRTSDVEEALEHLQLPDSPERSSEPAGAPGPADPSGAASLNPIWCAGPGVPIEQLRSERLPLPSFVEVIQPLCQKWLTPADVHGRQLVQWSAQTACQRNAGRSVEPQSLDVLLRTTLPPGSVYEVETFDFDGGIDLGGAILRQGHTVAAGAFGAVFMVEQLTDPKGGTDVESAEGDGAAAEGSAGASVSPRSPRGRSLEKVASAFRSFPKVIFSSLRHTHTTTKSKAVRDTPSRAGGPLDPSGKSAGGRLPSHSTSKTQTADSSSNSSLQSSGVGEELTTPTKREEAEAAPGEQTPQRTSGHASTGAAGATGLPSRTIYHDQQHDDVFLKRLLRKIVHNERSAAIYAAKMAVALYEHFPLGTEACLRRASEAIDARVQAIHKLMTHMPRGFTPRKLYDYGFVLPIAAVRVKGSSPYLSGNGTHPPHLLNFMQIMRPQLADVFDIYVADFSAVTYMAKRLIQLVAHVGAAGLVHLDIKRENIGVSPSGELTLLDFDFTMREGAEFRCRDKPTLQLSSPEIARKVLSSYGRGVDELCVAHESLDSWNLGVVLFEIACQRELPFPCYSRCGLMDKLRCIAGLKPPSPDPSAGNLSPTRAPIRWGRCQAPEVVRRIIEGLLDLNPENRLQPLQLFVYGDLFRSHQT